MCGIVGVLSLAGENQDQLESLVRRMSDCIRHRGPDDSGVFADANSGIALGFRRLAIVDLSELGHQPMVSASGRFTIVFNGEIYNFEDLRSQLQKAGCAFRGRSDTEVALAAFETWGVEESLRRFNGMFAIALWDRQQRELILARDRVGKKPLFLYQDGGTILFGSELKALLNVPGFDRSLDPEAVELYLRHMYVPAPRCIFRKAEKVPPGTMIVFGAAGATLRRRSVTYWSLREVAASARERVLQPADEHAAEEQLHGLLRDSVRLRMQADVPLGALLSGGIDSSLVVALMADMATQPILTYTIGFDVPEYDEAEHARAVAAHLGTRHTELYLDGSDVLSVVPKLPAMFDEPLADPSQIPTYLVCELARRSVTVALTGDGGDELFAGYHRYIDGSGMIASFMHTPPALRRGAGAALDALPQGLWKMLESLAPRRFPRLLESKVRKTAALLQRPDARDMYRSLLSVWQDPGNLMLDGSRNNVRNGDNFWDDAHLLRSMMLADQLEYLPDDLLAKLDRASMAVSLEARAPLLDYRVVEFSWRLAPGLLLDRGVGKKLLRRLLHLHVPRELVERPKMGFSVPVADWLAGPLREMATDLLSRDAIASGGILDPERVAAAWSRFLRGDRRDALGLWTIVQLEAWRRKWIAPVAAAAP